MKPDNIQIIRGIRFWLASSYVHFSKQRLNVNHPVFCNYLPLLYAGSVDMVMQHILISFAGDIVKLLRLPLLVKLAKGIFPVLKNVIVALPKKGKFALNATIIAGSIIVEITRAEISFLKNGELRIVLLCNTATVVPERIITSKAGNVQQA